MPIELTIKSDSAAEIAEVARALAATGAAAEDRESARRLASLLQPLDTTRLYDAAAYEIDRQRQVIRMGNDRHAEDERRLAELQAEVERLRWVPTTATAPPIPGPTARDAVAGMLLRLKWDETAHRLSDGTWTPQRAIEHMRAQYRDADGAIPPEDVACIAALEAFTAREACRAGHGVEDACAECAPNQQPDGAAAPADEPTPGENRAYEHGIEEGERRAKAKAADLLASWEAKRAESARLRGEVEHGTPTWARRDSSALMRRSCMLELSDAFDVPLPTSPTDPGQPPTGGAPDVGGFPEDVPPEVDEQIAEISAIVDERVTKVLEQRRARVIADLTSVIAAAISENLLSHEIAYRVLRRMEHAHGLGAPTGGEPGPDDSLSPEERKICGTRVTPGGAPDVRTFPVVPPADTRPKLAAGQRWKGTERVRTIGLGEMADTLEAVDGNGNVIVFPAGEAAPAHWTLLSEAPPADAVGRDGEKAAEPDPLAEHMNAVIDREEAMAMDRAHADGIVEGLERARGILWDLDREGVDPDRWREMLEDRIEREKRDVALADRPPHVDRATLLGLATGWETQADSEADLAVAAPSGSEDRARHNAHDRMLARCADDLRRLLDAPRGPGGGERPEKATAASDSGGGRGTPSTHGGRAPDRVQHDVPAVNAADTSPAAKPENVCPGQWWARRGDDGRLGIELCVDDPAEVDDDLLGDPRWVYLGDGPRPRATGADAEQPSSPPADTATICNGSGGIDYSDGSDRACPGCAACSEEPPPDPLEPYRAKASAEQRAACLHPPDDRQPLSGDGWLCGLCGADCARPEALAEELTEEVLRKVEERARYAHSTAFRTGKILAAATLALASEVRRLRALDADDRPVITDPEEGLKAWRDWGKSVGAAEASAPGDAPAAPDREQLGREVHAAWLDAKEHISGTRPRIAWAQVYDDLQEVDRRIGERLFDLGAQHGRAAWQAATGAPSPAEASQKIAAVAAEVEKFARMWEDQGARLHELEGRPPQPMASLVDAVLDVVTDHLDLPPEKAPRLRADLLRRLRGELASVAAALPRLHPVDGPVAALAEQIASYIADVYSQPADGELRAMPTAIRVLGMVDEFLRGARPDRANGAVSADALTGLDAGGGP
ncbi:hypothetical protein [Sorangium sp. So ce388]|uniref:hypothetical protein n=1 Tax=Sorangium sp. So ce388 TaxID=3133309 RepID=UPI003F5BF0D8